MGTVIVNILIWEPQMKLLSYQRKDRLKENLLFIFFRGALISGTELGPTSKWVGPLLITCEESCGKLKTQVELLSFLFLPKTKQNEKNYILFFKGKTTKKGYFVKKNCFPSKIKKPCKLTFSHNCVWQSGKTFSV